MLTLVKTVRAMSRSSLRTVVAEAVMLARRRALVNERARLRVRGLTGAAKERHIAHDPRKREKAA